jgi:hypothetical protein
MRLLFIELDIDRRDRKRIAPTNSTIGTNCVPDVMSTYTWPIITVEEKY